MAKPATEREARRESKEARGAKGDAGPLAEASRALSRGDVRTARRKLDEIAHSGNADEAAKARAISDGLGVDKLALAAAGGVLAVIAFAAIAALFLRHG